MCSKFEMLVLFVLKMAIIKFESNLLQFIIALYQYLLCDMIFSFLLLFYAHFKGFVSGLKTLVSVLQGAVTKGNLSFLVEIFYIYLQFAISLCSLLSDKHFPFL